MSYHGDYAEDSTNFSFKITTRTIGGAASALTWSTGIQVYKDEEVAQSTAGITFTTTFDSVVGLNLVEIDLSADAFYVVGSNYSVVITSGTVNSVSVAGEVLGEFSIENRFSTNAVTDALTNYGVSTVSSASQLNIATTALETHGASTITSTDVDDSLTAYDASTHTTTDVFDQAKNAITTLSVASTANLDTALTNYGASTLGTTEFKDITTTALEDYGASTHTTTDVFDQAKNAISTLSVASTGDLATALNTYGASTLGTSEYKDVTTTALEDYGASTHTSTDVRDQIIAGLSSDTYSEPAQGAPDSTATIVYKLGLIYKSLINKKGATASEITLYNDDAATVDHKRTISGSSTFYDEEKFTSGP